MRSKLNAGIFQRVLTYCSGGNKPRRNSAGKMTASPIILISVIFFICRIIGMTGTAKIFRFFIISALGITVRNHDTDRCSGCFFIKNTAHNRKFVGFSAGCGDFPCGTAKRKTGGDIIGIDFRPGSNSVKNNAYSGAVALSRKRNGYIVAESIFHFRFPLISLYESFYSYSILS